MAKPRWIAPWKDSTEKPAIYHVISRVVDRRFALGDTEKEKFRTLMRMTENFSGCRVLAYCVMSNHFHILLEVPPRPADGISDDLLLTRLSALYSQARVGEIRDGLKKTRREKRINEVERIHAEHGYRMHDLSEFMKTLLQRFTTWLNRYEERSGRLWEQRFKSVIVESGTAARIVAAYIDLNPVRAGIVKDPADYHWSSFGEATHGGKKGWGKKAREGLVRAVRSAEGTGFDAGKWTEITEEYRQLMGMALERKPGRAEAAKARNPIAAMLLGRVRYFTDGAVIGSRGFVDEFFRVARDKFSPRRKDGARKFRGAAAAAAGSLWSARDLKVGVV